MEKSLIGKRPQSSIKKTYSSLSNKAESGGSNDESTGSTDSETEEGNQPHFTESSYNPKDFENLDAPAEIKELFQHIVRYTPQKIDVEYRLQPFIPDYIPAVGDIDAFLKVTQKVENPDLDKFIAVLGLKILDEPCGAQSEPALLHMKLRSMSTSVVQVAVPPPAIAKSARDVERWIQDIQTIHAGQPQQKLVPTSIDIDTLMSEWPVDLEKILGSVGFPSASLDCSLTYYIEILCSLLDIPIPHTKNQADYITALYTIFNLYSAIKNN